MTFSENTLNWQDTGHLESLRKAARIADDADALIALRDARLVLSERMPARGKESGDLMSPDVGALCSYKSGQIPSVDARDLEIGVLVSAMREHGALIVRRLLSNSQSASIRQMIDRTINAALATDQAAAEDVSRISPEAEWFHPLSRNDDRRTYVSFVRNSGSVEMFLSPRTSDHLLATYESLGLRGLLEVYFDDAPCVSFKKSVLRRVSPLLSPADWHQDGAFMSPDIKSLNLWVALTPCGEGKSAPGIDLVPQRLTEILPTGSNGANFEWSVSSHTVHERFGEASPVRPTFNIGDAIFFDHYNLHMTSFGAEFTEKRYALETWFFAINSCPENQSPAYW